MRAKLALLLIGAVAVAAAGAFAYDVYVDRLYAVRVLEETPLLAEGWPAARERDGKPNRVVATLPPGAQPEVLRIRYGKDYMAIRVRAESDLEGWVILGHSLELTPP